MTPTKDNASDQDGLILASDFAKLSLNTQTVILAGCSTGFESDNKRLGMESLINSFVFAGAENIVATYWPIESGSNKIVIANYLNNTRLYEGLKYKHPLFWAALFRVNAN